MLLLRNCRCTLECRCQQRLGRVSVGKTYDEMSSALTAHPAAKLSRCIATDQAIDKDGDIFCCSVCRLCRVRSWHSGFRSKERSATKGPQRHTKSVVLPSFLSAGEFTRFLQFADFGMPVGTGVEVSITLAGRVHRGCKRSRGRNARAGRCRLAADHRVVGRDLRHVHDERHPDEARSAGVYVSLAREQHP